MDYLGELRGVFSEGVIFDLILKRNVSQVN